MEPTALERQLGYAFRDKSLLRRALTHPSHGAGNNQRLEFLGDAVLQLVMSHIVYAAHPGMEEGGLTFLRARMVRQETLCFVARRLRLGPCLRMDTGCEQSGGRTADAILADAMEAVLGAVYLDGGLDSARDVILSLWPDEGHAPIPMTDNKTALQELLQSRGLPAPDYYTLSQDGPAHMRSFTAGAFCKGKELGRGVGGTKKRAEQEAAGAALNAIRASEDAP